MMPGVDDEDDDLTLSTSTPTAVVVTVFVKLPRPGFVKTRLAAGVGAEKAAAFYRACAERTVDVVCRCERKRELVEGGRRRKREEKKEGGQGTTKKNSSSSSLNFFFQTTTTKQVPWRRVHSRIRPCRRRRRDPGVARRERGALFFFFSPLLFFFSLSIYIQSALFGLGRSPLSLFLPLSPKQKQKTIGKASFALRAAARRPRPRGSHARGAQQGARAVLSSSSLLSVVVVVFLSLFSLSFFFFSFSFSGARFARRRQRRPRPAAL